MADAEIGRELSLVHGVRLEEEPGIGALTIPGYLAQVAERFATCEAVVLNTGATRIAWTYEQLHREATAVARALIACGAGKNTRVGILMTNRPEFLAALFGIAMSGGIAVALSTFSTMQELEYLVGASEVSILLYEEHILKRNFRHVLAELEPEVLRHASEVFRSARFPYLTKLIALGGVQGDGAEQPFVGAGAIETWHSFLARGEHIPSVIVQSRSERVVPSDTGGIFFSSGTTSLPKGIVHEQRAFAIQWWRWPRIFSMQEPVRSWTGNGFFWSGNVSMVVGTALSTGGAIILQRYFEENEALRLMQAERVSFANGRPHQWARLQAASNWATADLSSLKYVPRGELLYEHPTVTTNWQTPMSFGTTETMTICTSVTGDPQNITATGNCGKPLPGNTLKIVDSLSGAILPRGEHGEMCIKGPTLMSTYLGKPREACFDPEGFYCTGDGGRVDAEGRFFWEGRLTDMIKTGGANVAPEEVDSVIANYPGIKRSQTVGLPDDLLGEIVVSCVVPVSDRVVAADALTAYLKERLASFKIPRRILFFSDEDLSLTGSGKIKTAELRALALARLGLLEAT